MEAINCSDEWKQLFPIGTTFTPPLLQSSPSPSPSSSISGPLLFNPKPSTLTQLFNSPTISPPLLNPPTPLSLNRFLSTNRIINSSSIASKFLHTQYETASPLLYNNRLHLLHCFHNNHNFVVAFFPTGHNHNQVGYLVLSVKHPEAEAGGGTGTGTLLAQGNLKGDAFTTDNLLPTNQRILNISVIPIHEDDSIVGLLMAVTMHSLHLFTVVINNTDIDNNKPVVLRYLGYKQFKTSSIVTSCWNPHIPFECLVLLDSGQLYLFEDLDSSLESSDDPTPRCFKGTRLKLRWNDSMVNSKWLGCAFSWHPRIFIVASTDAVYLVDVREDTYELTCLMTIDVLRFYHSTVNERFLALSNAPSSDGFQFIMASTGLLVLCDVRKPMLPVLQWAHSLDNPCCIEVFRLSDLRSHSRDTTYEKATESGFGIWVGSFLNSEFALFCYGPQLAAYKGSVTSQVAKLCKSFYAWELPSDLWLSGRGCPCGRCVIREEFFKDDLPEWVDWQQKKELVLGFGLLSNDLSAMLSEPDEFGGFTLIRLLSSGKLEAQRYCASWDLVKKSEACHKDLKLECDDNLLYSLAVEDYKFRKVFKYLNLDNLYAHLNDNLFGVLDSKMKKSGRGRMENESFSLEFHEVLCEKLNTCGFGRFRTTPAVSAVFNDISLPTSLREVALRRAWAELPVELLHMAFSSYDEFLDVLLDKKKVSSEFLVVPELAQLPPFFLRKLSCRSNKWSQRVQRDDSLVGPVLPLAVLLNLHELNNGCPNSQNGVEYSAEAELSLHCNDVKQVAKEMVVGDSGSDLHDDHVVALGDDDDDQQMLGDSEKSKSFVLYRPATFENSDMGSAEMFSTLISKIGENDPPNVDKMDGDGLQGFDSLCPFAVKFDTPSVDLKLEEEKGYNLFKRQFSKWQENFDPYQSFCNQSKLQCKDP